MTDILQLSDSRPSRADAVKNRSLLLETAHRLFQEQGVEAVSMSAVAEAARVGKGTLYRHFKNKAELCNALLDQEQRQLQLQTFERLRTNGDPLDNLRWFLRELVNFTYKNTPLLYVGASESGITLLDHPAHIWWRQTIRALLHQMRPIGDLDYITDVLYVMVDAHTIHFQRYAMGYDLIRIQDGLITTLLHFLS
ncbi:MAG: TetR/AcrR family transcriptional regulator [Anaerolineae bacterium]|jgi:AcrR family transcriptional regulator|nr:TetR/AcrR family transcriptional regulator [Anaerolineae bacterium]